MNTIAAKDWYVLRRLSLGGTPNDCCSGGEYGIISGLKRHIERKDEDEGNPQERVVKSTISFDVLSEDWLTRNCEYALPSCRCTRTSQSTSLNQ